MRTAPSRRLRLAAATAAGSLLLGACSGAPEDPAAQPSEESAATTSATTSVSPSASPSDVPSAAVSDPVSPSAAAGSWDRDTLLPAVRRAMEEQGTAHVTMTTQVAGADLEAEGDVDFGSPQQDLRLVMDGQVFGTERAELRRVDGVVYLSMPPVTPEGAFIAMRPGDGGLLTDMPGVDPADTFEAFDAGLEDVAYVGSETVAGEELERYRLTVRTREAVRSLGLPRASGLPETVPYDVWVDAEALPRRIEVRLDRAVSLVMETSDWGDPVTVRRPARRDIVEPPGH